MAKGKKTGGRRPGSRNKRTQDLLDKVAAEGITPLDYCLQVMRDESANIERRDEMARAALPYLHARRAPENKDGGTAPAVVLVERPPLEKPK
jgi:hypothetical protein